MAAAEDTTIPLEPDGYYHIFNRGNNRENIFYSTENYRYFLRRYDFYLSEFVDTYCFCLLPNHFHLLIRVRPEEYIRQSALPKTPQSANQIVSEQFRRFFLSYAKSINRQIGRTGSLFQKPFRRKKVDHDAYFTALVAYIHNNPVHHRIEDEFKTYRWSSYARILADDPSKLMRQELLRWFGGKPGYIGFHQTNLTLDSIQPVIIE